MALSFFSLTEGGALLALKLRERFGGTVHLPACQSLGCSHCDPFDSLGEALPERFLAGDSVVCVMAAGIVFRLLAPHLRGKQLDEAVIVIDETGRYVIPLLGGHAAGANGLAAEIAGFLGGEAVITTSSDTQGLLSPDELARKLGANVDDSAELRLLSSLLVNGGRLCIESPFEVSLPGYEWIAPGEPPDSYQGRVLISWHADADAENCGSGGTGSRASIPTLKMIPRLAAAGVGCRRGTAADEIVSAIAAACRDAEVEPACIATLASIDLKQDERGLAEAAAQLSTKLVFFPAETLDSLGRPGSEFVKATVGSGAVAEPAALLACGAGAELLAGKRAFGRVTVALAAAWPDLAIQARAVKTQEGRQ